MWCRIARDAIHTHTKKAHVREKESYIIFANVHMNMKP